jgi:hypothetical protein
VYKQQTADISGNSRERNKVADAFSHFSYVTGNGAHVITISSITLDSKSLELVVSGVTFFHGASSSSRMNGDLGTRQVDIFIRTHTCNDHCKRLGLLAIA